MRISLTFSTRHAWAIKHVAGKSLEQFKCDVQCQDAVIRRLEIIGEAARRMSLKTQEAFPETPWKDVIGMRNVMIHQYGSVDVDIVWNTVKNNLPNLIDRLSEKQ